MALLDVTEVLTDPDFVDTSLLCQRMTQTISDAGIATNSPQYTQFAGVVTAYRGDLLERLADSSKVKGSITIHTKFPLIAGDCDSDADVVLWQDKSYTVTEVQNYGNFGAGFVAAMCELVPFTG